MKPENTEKIAAWKARAGETVSVLLTLLPHLPPFQFRTSKERRAAAKVAPAAKLAPVPPFQFRTSARLTGNARYACGRIDVEIEDGNGRRLYVNSRAIWEAESYRM